jgi:tetratricopeptide (TPR) repeat protein
MKNSTPNEVEQSASRKKLFRIITFTFPLIILLIFEGALRIVSYGDNLKLFVENPIEGYEDYLMVNPSIGKKYFQKFEYDAPSNDIFLKKKPKDAFRIFVMGSSTVVGFPFEKNLMFSRILHKRLEDTYPEKKIEVVNTAITAVNSYTLYDYSREILEYSPDAVLIYAGHNEFYGAFGSGSNESMSKSIPLTRMHLKFMDIRIYQLFRNIASGIQGKISAGKDMQVHGTLMKRIVANNDIEYDSDIYSLTIEKYEQNMGDMLKRFSEKDIPVFLGEVVSNVKDIKPLSSSSTDSINEACQIYNRAAEENDSIAAKNLFYKAKDLDGVRFRASEEINQIIHELSIEYGSYTIPMLKYFQEASPRGLIGNNLMTEHVHPNIAGNFLLADAFYSEIVNSGIIGEYDSDFTYSSEYYKRNWGYSSLDLYLAQHRVSNLSSRWPFVPVDSDKPDYRLSYNPRNQIDALAFNIFKDPELKIEDKRLELAEAYDKQGKYYEAFKEYNAMVYTNPYVAINYRDAASALLKLQDLPAALKYFKKSEDYEKTFFASYRIGEIYIMKGDFRSARKSFEQAFTLSENDEDKIKTLAKLYMACSFGNQLEEAGKLAEQLKRYNATSYLNIPPKSYVYMNYIPYMTRKQISEAQNLLTDGAVLEASEILEASLEIYDSHVAHRYLGEIYLQLKEISKAGIHFNQVVDEFSFDPEFLEELAVFYKLSGDTQKEKEIIEKLNKIN